MNFWSQFTRSHCYPDNCNCEFIRDALICQPSAFWSSGFYIIGALILYREIKEKSFLFNSWIVSILILGLASHFIHASFIALAVGMDFGGIILVITFFPLMRGIAKITSSKPMTIFILFIYYILVGSIFFMDLGRVIAVSFCLFAFVIALVDLRQTMGPNFLQARLLQYSLGTILISFIFFLIDELKIWCDPLHWFQGHSLWHLGGALSLYSYGKWRFHNNYGLNSI